METKDTLEETVDGRLPTHLVALLGPDEREAVGGSLELPAINHNRALVAVDGADDTLKSN